ncbi:MULTISPECIES: PorT [Sphingobacterium]|uniref:PorT n=1 Tax=Sphingobacterium TaxID=28453 RepID=UPI0013DBA986|nr:MULTISPECIES: PorT [unclassified Sphingobacterium]
MKNTVLVIAGFLFCLNSFGQRKFSLPFSSAYNEDAMVLLGIQYNMVSQSYQLQLEKDWQKHNIYFSPDDDNNLGELKGIQSKPSIGFSVGIPIDIRANENLYFTFNPSFLFFNGLDIEYMPVDPNEFPKVENGILLPKTHLSRRQRHVKGSSDGSNFNAFEFPLSIKFRSDEKTLKNKFNRYRGYLIGGARYTRWIGINGEYDGLQALNTSLVNNAPHSLIMKPGYLSWEVGFGADIFFAYFKMSPEIKFNQSFSNVFDSSHPLANDNKFMAPIDRGLIRNIYVSLIFQ